MTDGERRGPGRGARGGALLVAAIVLLGGLFFWLLTWMTRGRMHGLPPETRPPPTRAR